MLTSVEMQGTTAKNYWDESSAITCRTCNSPYVSNANSSGICINAGNDSGLLTNKWTCEDPYRLDACGCWQPATITLEENFANQISAEIARKISKQKDPLEKNSTVDEVEIPQMSGFIEI